MGRRCHQGPPMPSGIARNPAAEVYSNEYTDNEGFLLTFEAQRCNNDIGNKGVAYMMRCDGAACFRIPSVREDDSPGSELIF